MQLLFKYKIEKKYIINIIITNRQKKLTSGLTKYFRISENLFKKLLKLNSIIDLYLKQWKKHQKNSTELKSGLSYTMRQALTNIKFYHTNSDN